MKGCKEKPIPTMKLSIQVPWDGMCMRVREMVVTGQWKILNGSITQPCMTWGDCLIGLLDHSQDTDGANGTLTLTHTLSA